MFGDGARAHRPGITVPGRDLQRRLPARSTLIDFEVTSSLRGLLLGKKIDETTAHSARGDFAAIPMTRYPLAGIEERVWELRSNFNPDDASYITLAEALQCPLYTYDAKLVAPRLHDADVRLLGRTR